MISFILNIPYTVIGLVFGLISLPINIKFHKNPCAFIFTIKKFWWAFGFYGRARAMAIGHVVLLGPNIEKFDLEHELVHVNQCERLPLIMPILYTIESIKYGYKNNKYEQEAYRVAGNIYKE